MKLSIVIPILNSHEIVRRQILYYEKMDIPDGVEILFIDDGSDPPITSETKLKNFFIYQTNDFRPWTIELARNFGIRKARGEYVLITDIDYVIPRKTILDALTLKEDKTSIRREFGVLDENGNLTQDLDVLRTWGLTEDRIKSKGVMMPPHPNNYVMKRSVFDLVGYYDENRVMKPYPIGADAEFKRRWDKFKDKGLVTVRDNALRPVIYMLPNGQYCGDVDYNPFGLFHTLTRKTEYNMELQRLRDRGLRRKG
jgi:glycosyltransferase involved in cell wall biosynthesis